MRSFWLAIVLGLIGVWLVNAAVVPLIRRGFKHVGIIVKEDPDWGLLLGFGLPFLAGPFSEEIANFTGVDFNIMGIAVACVAGMIVGAVIDMLIQHMRFGPTRVAWDKFVEPTIKIILVFAGAGFAILWVGGNAYALYKTGVIPFLIVGGLALLLIYVAVFLLRRLQLQHWHRLIEYPWGGLLFGSLSGFVIELFVRVPVPKAAWQISDWKGPILIVAGASVGALIDLGIQGIRLVSVSRETNRMKDININLLSIPRAMERLIRGIILSYWGVLCTALLIVLLMMFRYSLVTGSGRYGGGPYLLDRWTGTVYYVSDLKPYQTDQK